MNYTLGEPIKDTKAPEGPIEDRWEKRKFSARLVNPANKRKINVIVVGTGLAGGSAAATLGELGYKVKSFCYQDSPRRAHSIAAQGGINAAKNYRGDGDSIYRLFYDTVKGGDFRARESNVYRLAQVSVNIIDQCGGPGRAVRPRVRRPARHPLLRRRPGVAHLLRPRPDGPAAPARRLLGAGAADRGRDRRDAHPPRDARADRHRRRGRAASWCATWSPARSRPTWPTRSCWPPAATATSSSCRPTPRAATPRRSGGPTRRGPCSPTRATPRSTRPASRSPASTSRS